MSDTEEFRRKRLVHRSRYRGAKLRAISLFGQFAAAHLGGLDAGPARTASRRCSTSRDQDVLAWVYGRPPVPARHDNDVFALLRRFEPAA